MEGLLSLKEVSEILKVSLSTLNRWIRKGQLKAYKIANQRAIRVKLSDIDELLKPIEGKDRKLESKDINSTKISFLNIHLEAVKTGIRDLAHHHDHYLYGVEKNNE